MTAIAVTFLWCIAICAVALCLTIATTGWIQAWKEVRTAQNQCAVYEAETARRYIQAGEHEYGVTLTH